MSIAVYDTPAGTITQPADTFDLLIAAWMNTLDSDHSRRAYTRDFTQWREFCDDTGAHPMTARRMHVDQWARNLKGSGLKPRTVARKLSVVSSFYIYCVDEKILNASPCTKANRPKVSPDGETPGLNRDEMRRLIAAARGLRAVALLTLLEHTGIRISEALNADVTDLGHDRGHRILRITRKGGVTARTVLSPPVDRAVAAYIAGRVAGPIFITDTGRRMQQPEAWRLVRRTARRAGLESAGELSPHSLRVAFITGAREAGVPLEDVQDAAGHADPRTTRRYDRGRHSLDRHATYALTAWLADGQDG